jgi:hypothetical protein
MCAVPEKKETSARAIPPKEKFRDKIRRLFFQIKQEINFFFYLTNPRVRL